MKNEITSTNAQGITAIILAEKSAPEKPGVYKMLNKEQKALYVGKALNLKKRISQYKKPSCDRIQKMLSQVDSVETIVTGSELDALILEAELVKSLQPKYNILLKDDKSLSFIRLTLEDDFPRIYKYKGKRHKGCYGPFFSSVDANNNIVSLQKAFLLRPCSNRTFNSRSRPCIEYQIKRCSAPCTGKISREEYAKSAQQAQAVLEGKANAIQTQLIASMEKASKSLEYEKAALYRDRIRSLQQISTLPDNAIEEGDVFGICTDMEWISIKVLLIRSGQRCGDLSYLLKLEEPLEPQQMVADFIMQYCQKSQVQKIYINMELPPIYLEALKVSHKIEVCCPKRGGKLQAVKFAHENAKANLKQKISLEAKNLQNLQMLQQFFQLPTTPERIEIYDNSHISGAQAVGVMVVMTREGFRKNAYRKFSIKNSTKPDDYAMMEEVFERRFKHSNDPPDFVLIDGGVGHLGAVKATLEQHNIPFAGISKGPKRKLGEEIIHVPGRLPVRLPANDPLLYFLQNLRDEAHRFAIASHRNKRLKNIELSTLDDIKNIGKQRKKALMAHFRSIKELAKASPKQLAAIPGISEDLAIRIIDHLNNRS